jgi:2-polyprenyl-6-methoxyphenol hydroxylase-like FAD-dependent oxidoreductase
MTEVLRTQCCIAGGGPAGAMLGLLLARQGLDVVVLEKHADFLRDFRGDTIHPSTMEVLDQLGLASAFLALGPARVSELSFRTPTRPSTTLADFHDLRSPFPFIALIPQWDFLNFITAEAARYPGFRLLMSTEATGLVEEDGAIRGVRFRSPRGDGEIRATLTVAADGRRSILRQEARLPMVQTSPPIDVLWFRLPHTPGFSGSAGALGNGRVVALIDRRDYWQVGYTIPKGSADRLRTAGIDALRRAVADAVPELSGAVQALESWDQVSLLSVQADRLRRWHLPGLLCIGDAAHAMSPVGGVGINFAIQDAVEAANLLAGPLRRGTLTERDLARVQRRRAWQVWIMQLVQARMLAFALAASRAPARGRRRGLAALPAAAVQWLMTRAPARRLLNRVAVRVLGRGIRPARVRQPATIAAGPLSGEAAAS